MAHQSPKPPSLALRLALAGVLLALLFGLGRHWEADYTPIPVVTSVTVKPAPLLHTPVPAAPPARTYEEPAPPLTAPRAPSPSPALTGIAPRIAVIIDDMGINRQQSGPVLQLPVPVTVAFLPYGRATPALAAEAAAKGFEVMLHMPMQPAGPDNPGPDAITSGLDPVQVGERLAAAQARVPQAVGVNNHMGSAATVDAALMDAFMQMLQPTGQFFVDSYTSADSVAYAAATAHGVPALRRDVFLDNDQSPEAIWRQISRAEGIARRHGQAIVIGHPYPSTIAVLREWLPRLEQQGMRVVKVGELLKEP
jgi:polysaccharide deacetylase 2 family uncharacterized protein YibQ